MEEKQNNPLGSEPIGTLIARFAIPSIIAMLVSSLYNIVDQFFIGRSVGMLGNAATNVAFPLSITCARFAIPSIIAMLVSSLYNIVDQFFIGRSVGMLGNAATNVAFPLSITCTAISLLCGIGGAANFNLAMGRKEKEKAVTFAGGSIGMMLILGVLLCVISQIFLEPMMRAFGATEKVLDYSLEYTGITALGFPFLIVTTGGSNLIISQIFLEPMMRAFGATEKVLDYSLEYTGITALGFPFLIVTTGGSNLIRADGSPKFSMMCTLVGAIINTILDPLFIFIFDMGIAGAAWATIIGQVVSGFMVLWYLSRFKTVYIPLKSLIPSGTSWIPIISLGIAPFFNQIAMMIVQIVMNNTLTYYGAQSSYGSDIRVWSHRESIRLLSGIYGNYSAWISFFDCYYGRKQSDSCRWKPQIFHDVYIGRSYYQHDFRSIVHLYI